MTVSIAWYGSNASFTLTVCCIVSQYFFLHSSLHLVAEEEEKRDDGEDENDWTQNPNNKACCQAVESGQNLLCTYADIIKLVKNLKTHRCVYNMDTSFWIRTPSRWKRVIESKLRRRLMKWLLCDWDSKHMWNPVCKRVCTLSRLD